MQDLTRDSVLIQTGASHDSLASPPPVFVEVRPSRDSSSPENIYARNYTRDAIPDWYFISILLILAVVAWLSIVYAKFINSTWVASYNFQAASKTFKDRGVVQKRFGFGLDLIYLVNASLFIFVLNRFGFPVLSHLEGPVFVIQAFVALSLLVFLRITVMRIIGFIFERSELFLEFLYHFFIYNKVIGLVLIPFLLAIPYTHGILQEIIIYTGVSAAIAVYIMRLFRVAVYVFKHVVLIFYLILYLCILEILPVLVIIKLVISLAQV